MLSVLISFIFRLLQEPSFEVALNQLLPLHFLAYIRVEHYYGSYYDDGEAADEVSANFVRIGFII